MRGHLTIGDKLGYLRPRTGRYEFAEIIGMTGEEITLRQVKKQGKFHVFINTWNEKTEKVIHWLKEKSADHQNKTLLKHKAA